MGETKNGRIDYPIKPSREHEPIIAANGMVLDEGSLEEEIRLKSRHSKITQQKVA